VCEAEYAGGVVLIERFLKAERSVDVVSCMEVRAVVG